MGDLEVVDKLTLSDRIKEGVKKPDTYRYLIFTVLFYAVFYYGIRFMSAGNSYDQAAAFRPFCIAVGLIAITLMDLNEWCHIFTLLYLPVWYVMMHFGYEKHIIPDTCEYQFVDIIRMGKLVALIWGIVLAAVLRNVIWAVIVKYKGEKMVPALEGNENFWKRILWLLKQRPGRVHKIGKIQPVLGILWILFAVWTAIFQRGYFYINFFLVGFSSLFYFMIGQRERKKLFWRAFCDGALVSLLFVLYKSLRHRPYDTMRYMSYFANSNMAGLYLATMVCVLFCRIDEWWNRRRSACPRAVRIVMLVLYYLLTGFTICLSLFNYTRTAILGLIFAFLTAFVVQMAAAKKKKWRVALKYGLVILCVAALFRLTYQVIRYVPAKFNEPFYFDAEYDPEKKIMKNDPADSPKYTSMAQYLRLAFGKWGILINFEEREQGEETTVEVDGRDVTNGRIGIWKTYLSRTNLTGHYPGHIEMEDGYFCYHAHNTYFHILYQYGAPAGLLWLLIAIFSYGYAIYIYVKKGKKSKYLFLALLLSAVCLVSQVTEWMGHPAYVICSSYSLIAGMLITETRVRKA